MNMKKAIISLKCSKSHFDTHSFIPLHILRELISFMKDGWRLKFATALHSLFSVGFFKRLEGNIGESNKHLYTISIPIILVY